MRAYRSVVPAGFNVAPVPPPVTTPGLRGATEALRHRDFLIFWVAALVSNTGSWMQNAAIPFVVFDLTGSNGDVGATGFWQYAPVMAMGVVGGSLADRFNRRRLLILTQIVQSCFAVLLYLDVAAGTTTVARMSTLAFLSGLAGGLNIPVWQSFVSQLVPRPVLANAVTLNSTQFNAARALGPLIGFGVATSFGPAVVFLINAVSFAAVLVALPFIHVGRERVEPVAGRSALADLADGARYVWAHPGIRACCLAIIAIAGLGSPLFSFLPASFGQEVFDLSEAGIGVLSGAGGIGALLAAPLLLTRLATVPRSQLLAGAMLAYAGGTVLVGLSPHVAVAVVGVVLFGGSYLGIASAINTTIQLLARDDMRGKSIAFYIMCLTGSLPVGLYAWGRAADQWGIRATTVGAGLALGAVTLLLSGTGRFAAMAAATPASADT